MPDQAKVRSIEALEAFRTNLIIYLEKAARVLDEVNHDVVRTRLWLEGEQRLRWEDQARRRARDLEQKQQELFSSRFSNLREASPLEQAAVRNAKRALNEAEAKLALVKKWNRQYDSRVSPLAKEVDKLREILDRDMRHAVAWLTESVKSLDAYANVPLTESHLNPEQETKEGGQT